MGLAKPLVVSLERIMKAATFSQTGNDILPNAIDNFDTNNFTSNKTNSKSNEDA